MLLRQTQLEGLQQCCEWFWPRSDLVDLLKGSGSGTTSFGQNLQSVSVLQEYGLKLE